MTQLQERDAMICRSCGREERASEGYPCTDCGTFVCMMCAWRGIERCAVCTANAESVPLDVPIAPDAAIRPATEPPAPTAPERVPSTTGMDWPEH